MNNVRAIGGPRKPLPDLVALLRELLEEAEAGRLTAMVGIAEYYDDKVEQLHAGEMDWWAASGRLHWLAYLLASEEDEDEEAGLD